MAESVIEVAQPKEPIKALVIDDAFDDFYASQITIDDYRTFYSEVNETGSYAAILEKLNIGIPLLNEWNDESSAYEQHILAIWSLHDNPELRPFIINQPVFAKRIENLTELNQLISNLKAQQIEPHEQKSYIDDYTMFQNSEFVYVFIDYNLGVQEGEEAVKNAQRVAKQVYDACPDDKKPITILMSSDTRDETLIEKFQEDAKWVEGVFRFSPKKDLSSSEKVSLLIRAYQEEFISNNLLQGYITSLMKASINAQEQFGKEIQKMKVEDYEYIYSSILRDNQQPLGDYMAWLYGSHWGNLLLKDTELKEKQNELDKIMTDKKPIHHSLPSKNISQIFMTALYEEGFDSLTHKWYENHEKLPNAPHLHLGDLFTATGSKDVYMIINPQCDLERPSKMDPQMSVFLIPGILDPIENQISNDKLKTEFFIFEERQYRIYWNSERVRSVPYEEIVTWLKTAELSRAHRLRLPFALEVQRRFTSNISRVGLPVSPPLHGSIKIRVGYKSFDDTVNKDFLPPRDNYGFYPIANLSRFNSKEKELYRLTLQFALDFKSAIVSEIARLRHVVDGEQISKKQKDFADKIEKFANKFDDWFFANKSFPKPKKVEEPIVIEQGLFSSVYSEIEQKNIKTIFWIEVMLEKIEEKDPKIDELAESKCTV